MNVLSQDDAFGSAVYSYTGCGTLAHWHLGLETMILSTASIKKEEKKAASRVASGTMKKINHYFENSIFKISEYLFF